MKNQPILLIFTIYNIDANFTGVLAQLLCQPEQSLNPSQPRPSMIPCKTPE